VSSFKNNSPEEVELGKAVLERWAAAAMDWNCEIALDAALAKVKNPNAKKLLMTE
jgi:hypothetical protein